MQALRPVWWNIFKFNGAFGISLILLLGLPRFIIVLGANVTGDYRWIPLIFIFMSISPFLFLTREGREFIGISKPGKPLWLLYSFLMGMIFCGITFLIAELFFGDSIGNWFVYISKSYAVSRTGLQDSERLIYFLIYAIVGMTFSPIGEELFYRGIVHGCFAVKLGDEKASTIDSLAFAMTHLAHFGIVFISGVWKFLLIPSLVWMLFMFATGKLFFFCRKNTGSIWGAVLGHAGYNLAMMYFIFYHVL